MTSREAITENIEFRCEKRIGFNFGGEGRRQDFAGAHVEFPFEPQKWEDERYEYYTDAWGNIWHRIKGMSQGGEVYKAALEDWSALDNLQLPDLANPAYFEKARKMAASEKEKFRLAGFPGWPFATCRYMRKMEIYFTDLVCERERIDILHDRVTTLYENVIDQFGQAGMDGLIFCEDLGVQDRTLMSPAMWRDIFRPLYERLTSRAHKHGMKVIQHSCGYNWALVDDLCDAGIDCLQFDQPAAYDQPALAAKLRRRGVGLFSPCDIQKILPTGNRRLIERECEWMAKTFRGGLIAKNYGDLHGIGVDPEWDRWAYEAFVKYGEF